MRTAQEADERAAPSAERTADGGSSGAVLLDGTLAPLTPQRVLALQRSAGNAAVGRLLRRTRGGVSHGARRLARKLSEADLAVTQASAIMADENYIDNNLTSFDFYDAQQAVLHYKDGSSLKLGLVPEWVTAPVEGVDYRSNAESQVSPADPGKLVYVPRAKETLMALPDSMTMGEGIAKVGRTVTFKLDATSGRIVPTQVNSLTAPRLCKALREAEAEYVKNFDAFAQGGKKVMKSLEIVVILASLLPVGGAAGAAGGGTTAAGEAAAASARAESKLLTFIKSILKGSKTAQVAVEGVDIGGFEAAVQGEKLMVRYSGIINSGRKAGFGRLVQSALERAAMAAGKQAGAKTVEVGVTTIINPAWQAYLESLGYVPELVQVSASQWTKVWIRVFSL